jgi:trans-aconitate methyltransferase
MKDKDDNNWKNYTIEYLYQIIETYRDKNNDFFITRFNVVADEGGSEWLEFPDNLHPNFMELYETAYFLNPKSILEIGCGGCYHLKNLRHVLPSAEIHGCDVSPSQISFGKWFSKLPKDIENGLFIMNFAKHKPERQYEFIFTQAVVMHQSYDNAMAMMRNVRDASSKYVMMIENPGHHDDWDGMIKDVFGKDWDMGRPSNYIQHAWLFTRK